MMTAYAPLLAHNPELILGLLAGAVLLVALLHALWYWFVHQVGFMLAAIGTRVERMSKILLPLVLVPVSGLVTIYVFALALFAAPEDASVVWRIVGLLLLVLLLLGLPYGIGRYMLRFSHRRSIISALCLAVVYGVVPLGMGLAWPDSRTEPESAPSPAPAVTAGEECAALPADEP